MTTKNIIVYGDGAEDSAANVLLAQLQTYEGVNVQLAETLGELERLRKDETTYHVLVQPWTGDAEEVVGVFNSYRKVGLEVARSYYVLAMTGDEPADGLKKQIGPAHFLSGDASEVVNKLGGMMAKVA